MLSHRGQCLHRHSNCTPLYFFPYSFSFSVSLKSKLSFSFLLFSYYNYSKTHDHTHSVISYPLHLILIFILILSSLNGAVILPFLLPLPQYSYSIHLALLCTPSEAYGGKMVIVRKPHAYTLVSLQANVRVGVSGEYPTVGDFAEVMQHISVLWAVIL